MSGLIHRRPRVVDDTLPANTHKIGWGVMGFFVFLAVIGLITPVLVAVNHSADNGARQTANNAAEANQRNNHCTTAQGLRWRAASTRFQIAISDLAEAQSDADKAAVHKRIRSARAELAAVQADDDRLKLGAAAADPLCPYVAGQPASTPEAPVHPTRAQPTR